MILYIDDEFNVSGGRNINYRSDAQNDPESPEVYYAGSNVFGESEFNLVGNVVVKDAQVELKGHSV